MWSLLCQTAGLKKLCLIKFLATAVLKSQDSLLTLSAVNLFLLALYLYLQLLAGCFLLNVLLFLCNYIVTKLHFPSSQHILLNLFYYSIILPYTLAQSLGVFFESCVFLTLNNCHLDHVPPFPDIFCFSSCYSRVKIK